MIGSASSKASPLREELGYPPFTRLANILVWGRDERLVRQVITEVTLAVNSSMVSAGCEWDVLAPHHACLRIACGLYRWHTFVKAPVDRHFRHHRSVLKARKANADARCRRRRPDNLF